MDISLKRIVAYVLDIILIILITSMLSQIKLINPYYDKYMDTYNRSQEIMNSDNKDIDRTVLYDLNMDLAKYKVYNSAISIVCLVLYFGLFEYLNNGVTLGQKAMKLKIVHRKTMQRAGLGNYLIRIVVINNILISIMAMLTVYMFSAKSYYYVASILGALQSCILLINVVMIILRRDQRGLHDMLSNTIVIPAEEVVEETPVEEV